MRITFILPTPSLGGGTRVVAEYARRLRLKGHDVLVIALPRVKPSLRSKIHSWIKEKASTTPHSTHLDGGGFDVRFLDKARPVTNEDVPDADVVIATWWETAEWVNSLSTNKGAKVYFIQHHEVFDYLPIERCRATYRMPFHKIVVARWLKRTMEEEYCDFTADLIPNSVDRSQFWSTERGKQQVPTVGFMYSCAEFKGVDITLAAIKLIREHFPNLRIVALTSERPKAHLPMPEGTEIYFSPPQNKLRSVYSSCDVWLTASRSEGFNLPAMEAMACRTPVVSSATGWPEEAIRTGWNGVLVDVGDVRTLADGAIWVLSQTAEDWSSLSSNALATVSSSSWDASTDLFEQSLIKASIMRAGRQNERYHEVDREDFG